MINQSILRPKIEPSQKALFFKISLTAPLCNFLTAMDYRELSKYVFILKRNINCFIEKIFLLKAGKMHLMFLRLFEVKSILVKNLPCDLEHCS